MLQPIGAGLLSALVGLASSFAVIVRGLNAMGATQAEAASGLMALSIAMGLCGILVCLRLRQPISVVWSTPGAALLASAGVPEGGFPVAVGAFLLSGALIVLAGLWRPLGRWVAAIPAPLANAMLAGILLPLCLAPIQAVAQIPQLGLPVVLVWAIVGRFRRLLAVPAAVVVACVLIAATAPLPPGLGASLWPNPVAIWPVWNSAAAIGIALPLFIVTMASQNIPGITVLRVYGFTPAPGPLFTATGIFSLLAAPFGGIAVNLAAITAAMCAGPDAHPDPARRYPAGVVAGLIYVLFGVFAGGAVAFLAASPPILIEAVAGLALLGAFSSSAVAALTNPDTREAAAVTFLVTGSGVAILGISGAFWGLAAGGALLIATRLRH